MVYLDTSVALAHLGAENVRPPDALWSESLISFRLITYETFSRLHAQGRGETHDEVARELLGRVSMLELVEPIVGRAAEPFPVSVRTLDAIHLASMLFLKTQGIEPRLATADRRLGPRRTRWAFAPFLSDKPRARRTRPTLSVCPLPGGSSRPGPTGNPPFPGARPTRPNAAFRSPGIRWRIGLLKVASAWLCLHSSADRA